MKIHAMLAATGLFLSACAPQIYPDGVLAGDALEARLTNTLMTLRPVTDPKRKAFPGAPTRLVVKMLQSGESTWETNGKFPRETLTHWDVRGNQLCLENPNQRFYDARRKKRGQKVRKRDPNANCGVIAIKGNLVTLYSPARRGTVRPLFTGHIKPL